MKAIKIVSDINLYETTKPTIAAEYEIVVFPKGGKLLQKKKKFNNSKTF